MRVAQSQVWIVAGALMVAVGMALARAETPTNPERRVADLLDEVIQPRFQVTNGKDFGISRIAPKIQGHGHMGMLKPESEKEAKTLELVATSGYEYKLGFVHTGFSLSRFSGKSVPSEVLPSFDRIWKDNKDYNDKTLPGLDAVGERVLAKAGRLERGHDIELASGEWHVFVRPVKSERETCASCHAGVQKNQVMGAMVYLIRKASSKP